MEGLGPGALRATKHDQLPHVSLFFPRVKRKVRAFETQTVLGSWHSETGET